ncbi:MAG: AMP-binding protein [Gammaproteobacteria bacterium]|nr:AMP-binding protein [Gammaproteobacteria bacterium]
MALHGRQRLHRLVRTASCISGRFEYFKDATKTEDSYRGDYFTLGDMGYFDEDGYLFVTGRTEELIISGGVNIYPQEVDSELLKHSGGDGCVHNRPTQRRMG